jgi:DNA-directed RNA polymerase subunit L
MVEYWKSRIIEIRDVTEEWDERFLEEDEKIFLIKYRVDDKTIKEAYVSVKKGDQSLSHPLAQAVKEIVERVGDVG